MSVKGEPRPFVAALFALAAATTLIAPAAASQAQEQARATVRQGPKVMPEPIGQGAKLDAALTGLLNKDGVPRGKDGGSTIVGGHVINYNVVDALRFDADKRLIGGAIQVVDDTDPNEAVYSVFTFRPNGEIDVGIADTTTETTSWDKLGLRRSSR